MAAPRTGRGPTWDRCDRRHGAALARAGRAGGGLAAGGGHPLLGPGSVHASLIEGGQELSTYPESCRLQLERRTLPGETVEVVEAELSELIEGVRAAGHPIRAELHTTLVRDPLRSTAVPPSSRPRAKRSGPTSR